MITFMKIKVWNIVYDTDGKKVSGLPKKMILDIPEDADLDSDIADIISDKTGWCVFSFDFKIVEEKA
jgi:hypothetical protein